ncbi:uncharacterized protein LY79DRAFT_139294 [Colletotrichum navitas]|uniref:Uncharacterized protein n=1 Tax=Colletotrichum navitas TaxID=681940 RepID=A0AAD8VBS8_9PEZI|nr:uncharacterized protein LY79DRAFT_139294 [Colletotrichum navitas]KAK1599388.1 hypothetical protein LY79DRAFT_139294 [Colletotrichum navitas]
MSHLHRHSDDLMLRASRPWPVLASAPATTGDRTLLITRPRLHPARRCRVGSALQVSHCCSQRCQLAEPSLTCWTACRQAHATAWVYREAAHAPRSDRTAPAKALEVGRVRSTLLPFLQVQGRQSFVCHFTPFFFYTLQHSLAQGWLLWGTLGLRQSPVFSILDRHLRAGGRRKREWFVTRLVCAIQETCLTYDLSYKLHCRIRREEWKPETDLRYYSEPGPERKTKALACPTLSQNNDL